MNFFNLLAILSVIGGILLLWMSVTLRRTYRASRRWPVTQGTITEAVVRQAVERRRLFYEAQITYSYTVNEQTYTGDRIYWADMRFSSRPEAEQSIASYPPGTEVEAHYNPDSPRK